MKRNIILLFIFSLSLICSGQVTLIGYTQINSIPLTQVNVSVKVDGILTKTLNTQNKSDFKLVFEFGKVYDIYFQHPASPVLYMQVTANTIPKEYYHYLMGYELVIPFVYKKDEDVDTTVFKKPFFKIYYDGMRSMVADTAYNNSFAHSVIKIPSKDYSSDKNKELKELHSLIAGKILIDGNPLKPALNRSVTVTGKSGEILKSGITNRSGVFAFSDIDITKLAGVSIQIPDSVSGNSITLLNSKTKEISSAKTSQGKCAWALTNDNTAMLVDNGFSYTIGGKLVSASAKEKKFFAEKDIYLLNKYNTVLKKTKTNLFGTFVFENIRPDASYCIAIDKEGILKGEKIDLLNKSDLYQCSIDSSVAGKLACSFRADNNRVFYDLNVVESELKMDVKATVFGDNINQPIGRLKIVLLNDEYEVIDSTVTDDFGTFKFKYLPFLKRFFLSAENTDNALDVFKNILIYSEEDNLIKIMTHQKGSKFSYKPVNAEISSLREIELEDPWLELVDTKKSIATDIPGVSKGNKLIVENILFEPGKYEISEDAKKILDKVILVLNANKNLKIEVGAHTDSNGSDEANLKLSELRAKMVVDYITKSSIGRDRIFAKGYGESQLVNHCKDDVPCTEAEQAQNRRIEFKILGEQ